MTDLFSLAGRSALVTGASSGLGRHFALTLAEAGADVALAARRRDRLEALAREVEALGRRAVPVAMDVADERSVVEGVASAWQGLGGIDVLVNNAGVSVPKFALETSAEEWHRVLDANLTGAFLVTREVARRMAERGQGGAIVNNASAVAFKVMKGLASYAASKAGLIQLTQALALEFARDKIRVNAIAPGPIATEALAGVGQDILDRVMATMCVPRIGQPEDLVGALLFLASDMSAWMSGQVLVVDGGTIMMG